MALCDYQPHPLYFVWAFLVAGLIRTWTSQRARLGGGWLVVELLAADLFGYRVFTAAVASSLPTIGGIVGAWLLSLAAVYPVRLLIAQRAGGRRCARSTASVASLSTLAAAAASSSLLLVLSLLVLKYELQERGAAFDAARYAWHIATFFLGAGFATSCAGNGNGGGGGSGRLPPVSVEETGGGAGPGRVQSRSLDSHDDGGCTEGQLLASESGAALPIADERSKASSSIASSHGLVLATMCTASAEAPLAASAVVMGAIGVLPAACCSGGRYKPLLPSHSRHRSSRPRRPLHRCTRYEIRII